MHIVPVTYVLHEGFIYIHSKEGLKIKVMRDNPFVCFQVDIIENMTNWRSVMIHGKYEELVNERDQQAALEILMTRLEPFTISETVKHVQNLSQHDARKGLRPVAYRISITEKTGRFEKR